MAETTLPPPVRPKRRREKIDPRQLALDFDKIQPPSLAHTNLITLIRHREPVDLPAAPAVYAIENLVDGKVYIGSSVNASRRVQHHWYTLSQRKHRNPYLQHAYDKHGRAQFRAFAVQLFPPGMSHAPASSTASLRSSCGRRQ